MAGVVDDSVPLAYCAPHLIHAGQVPSRVMSQPSGSFYQRSVAPQHVFVESSAPYEHPQFLQQSRRGRPIYRVIPKQDESRPLYGTAPIDRDKVVFQEAFRQALSQEERARASRGQRLHQFAPGFVNAPAAYPAYIVLAASLPQQSSSYQVNHGNEYPVWGIRTPVEESQVVSSQESLKNTSTFQPRFEVSGNQQPQPILTPHGFLYGHPMPSSTLAQRSLQAKEVPTLMDTDSVLPSQSAAPPRFGWNIFPVDTPSSLSSIAAAPLNVSEESTPMQQRNKTADATREDKVAASELHGQLIDYLSVLFPQATKERLRKAAEEALSPAMGSSKASSADPKKEESKESSLPTSSYQPVIKVIPVLDGAPKKEQKEVPVQRTTSKEVDRSGDEAQMEIEKVSLKKEEKKTLMDSETAAKKIQSVYRGYMVRRTQPLKHLRDIARVRPKLKEMQSQLSNQEDLEKRCTYPVERLKLTEGIMGLLLQLDSIQGVDPVVRDIRKSTAREVLRLQDLVDSTIVRISDSAQLASKNASDKGEEVAQSTQEDQKRKIDENVENIASTTSEVAETSEQQSVTLEEKFVAEEEAKDVESVEKVDVVLMGTPVKLEQTAEAQDETVEVLTQKLLEKVEPEERVLGALTKGVKPSFTATGTTSVRAKLVNDILKQLSNENEKSMAEEASTNITEDVLLSHVDSNANVAGDEPAQPPTLESASAVKSDVAPLYDQGNGSSLCSRVHEDQIRETSAACLEDAVSEEAKLASEALDGGINVVTSESVSQAAGGLGVSTGVEVCDDDEVNGEDMVASKPVMGEEESITNRDVAVNTCDDKPHAEQQLELPGGDLLQQESGSSSLEDNVEGLSSMNEGIRHERNFAIEPLNVEMISVEQPAGGVASLQHVSDQLRGEHFPDVETVQAESEVDIAKSRGTGEDSSNTILRSMKVSSKFVLENPPVNIDVSSPKTFSEKIRIPAPPTLITETLQEVGESLDTSSSLKEMCDSLRVLEASSQKSETGLTLTHQLIEENKKLKALLGDVLKWSQWQGSATLGLQKMMERLESEVLESKEMKDGRVRRKKNIVKRRR